MMASDCFCIFVLEEMPTLCMKDGQKMGRDAKSPVFIGVCLD